MPGSVHAVRNKTEITKMNNKAPTSGTAIVSFSYKYGQLNKTEGFISTKKEEVCLERLKTYSNTKKRVVVPIIKSKANRKTPICFEPMQYPRQ